VRRTLFKLKAAADRFAVDRRSKPGSDLSISPEASSSEVAEQSSGKRAARSAC
jgi:hypothetical protein